MGSSHTGLKRLLLTICPLFWILCTLQLLHTKAKGSKQSSPNQIRSNCKSFTMVGSRHGHRWGIYGNPTKPTTYSVLSHASVKFAGRVHHGHTHKQESGERLLRSQEQSGGGKQTRSFSSTQWKTSWLMKQFSSFIATQL